MTMTTETIPMEAVADSVEAFTVDSDSKQAEVVVENSYSESETLPVANSDISTGSRRGLKVLFLSSDTGGGHRASAESLGKQFQLLFPGTTFDLLDVVEKDGVPPYNSLVSYYKHLSAHPSQWKLVYSVSNSRAFEMLADIHLKLACERAVRRRIKSYNPDVVVSVHPLMTNVPVLSCSKISNETGRHLPIFTVVTDLGSAHCLWFASGVEKMFVGSEQVRELAKSRGKVPDEKLVMYGLPIRHDFAVQAEKLGDRMSAEGKAYQQQLRKELGLAHTDRKTILVMGGGEGVGSLSHIVDALYFELVSQGIDAVLLVVCGRNEKLRNALKNRNWGEIVTRFRSAKERYGVASTLMSFDNPCYGRELMPSAGCIEGSSVTSVTGSIRRMLSRGSLNVGSAVTMPAPEAKDNSETVEEEKKLQDGGENAASSPNVDRKSSNLSFETENSIEDTSQLEGKTPGKVDVVALGFITQVAEYMAASDVLVSKAGPGTISEAAALSLPIMLTSYLPGQEEGNVDFVIDGGFGAYCHDSDPIGIAEELCMWLNDEQKLANLSKCAKAKGAPYAARDIARAIGDSTMKWIEINDERAAAERK